MPNVLSPPIPSQLVSMTPLELIGFLLTCPNRPSQTAYAHERRYNSADTYTEHAYLATGNGYFVLFYPLAFSRPGVKRDLENNRVNHLGTHGLPVNRHPCTSTTRMSWWCTSPKAKLKSTTPEGKLDVHPISFGLAKFNGEMGRTRKKSPRARRAP